MRALWSVFLLFPLVGGESLAAWPEASPHGLLIAPKLDQSRFAALPSGDGIILVWNAPYEVRAQRVSADGTLLWGDAGLLLAKTGTHDCLLQAISDGSDGVVVFWGGSFPIAPMGPDVLVICHPVQSRFTPPTRYAQRLTADGKPCWGKSGLLVDSFSEGEKGVVAARLDATGRPKWCTPLGRLPMPCLAAASGETAYLLFQIRGEHGRPFLSVQALNGDGTWAWPDTLPACDPQKTEYTPTALADKGGLFLAWVPRQPTMWVHVQRIGKDASYPWSAEGIAVSPKPKLDQFQALAIPGPQDAWYLVWAETSRLFPGNLRVQLVRPDGSLAWTRIGVRVFGFSRDFAAAPTRDGGALVAAAVSQRLCVQRLDARGVATGPREGVEVVADPAAARPQIVRETAADGVVIAYVVRKALYCAKVSVPREIGED